jgi:hypothetical protein
MTASKQAKNSNAKSGKPTSRSRNLPPVRHWVEEASGWAANSSSHASEVTSRNATEGFTPSSESISRLRKTPGLTKRIANAVSTTSLPIPQQFNGSRLEWAADWCKSNGVTLPPDTSEYRSLRNWFCFQLQRWKKNKHTCDEALTLLEAGIDFAKYRAPNTGKAIMEPDEVYMKLLVAWKLEHGSFDLTADAPPDLQTWQKKTLTRFYVAGRSERLKKFESQVPGFRFALWRAPHEKPFSRGLLDWMNDARAFELAAGTTPAFRGNFDPRMDPKLVEWGKRQQEHCEMFRIPPRMRGVLHDLSILINRSEIAQNTARETLLAAERDYAPSKIGGSDRRLSSFLGAALFARKVHRSASDLELMTTFAISPGALLAARQACERHLPIFQKSTFRAHLTACRQIFLNAEFSTRDEFSYLCYSRLPNSALPSFEALNEFHGDLIDLGIEQSLA